MVSFVPVRNLTVSANARAQSGMPYNITTGFDENGDVTGFDPWEWYVWQADGTYVPLEQSEAKE